MRGRDHGRRSDEKSLGILQFVNTLQISDGGPARNSFELNLALNGVLSCPTRLVWFKGHRRSSVLEAAEPLQLPSRAPTKIVGGEPGIWELWREAAASRAWIVHGYYLWWVPLICLVALARRTPVFLMPHGTFTAHQRQFSVRQKQAFDALFGRPIRRSVRAFVVGSAIERADLREAIKDAPVLIVGAGTRVERMDREPSWNSPVRLLTLGRIARKKRIDLSIEATAALIARGVPAHLTVAGDGETDLTDELRRMAGRLGISESVEFAGQVAGDDKIRCLRSADMFILPSDDENFGIAAAEALASGLPVVVSTAVAAARGLPVEAGRAVQAPTGDSLADGILDLLAGSKVAASEAALDFATRFSWEAVGEVWKTMLCEEGILGSHTSAGP